MDLYDELQSYMIFGGIPYYMSLIRKDLSLSQHVDELCFNKKGALCMEFDRLFNSLFVNPESNKAVVRKLFKRKSGLMHKELREVLIHQNGGGLTTLLKGLVVGTSTSTREKNLRHAVLTVI